MRNFVPQTMQTTHDTDHIARRLNLPPAPLRLRRGPKGVEVHDPIRSKWLVLTPEEWVRQHFVCYLTTDRQMPRTMVANEMGITLNSTSKRCDTVIYAPDLRPVAIVEYKAPSVRITREVFDQIVRYNIVLKVRYLIVSNGLSHYCCRVDYEDARCSFIEGIPTYPEMLADRSQTT